MQTIILASRVEVYDTIHIGLFLYIFFLGLLPSFILWRYIIIVKKTSPKRFYWPILYLIMFCLSYFVYKKEFIYMVVKHRSNILAYDIIESFIEYKIWDLTHNILKKDYKIENITSKYSFSHREKKDKLNIILIIGESARADRFSFLGYERETAPKLSALKNTYANKASACATLTLKAVPCMLSPIPASHFSLPPKEGFIIDAFNFLGFHTTLFSTNDIRETDKVIANIYKSFEKYYNYRYQHDEVILPKLKEIIDVKVNNLIVLHSAGSHFQYYDRYPQKFGVFQPACNESVYSCSKEAVDNVYDNTIYYTDYIISEIINNFKDTNAILFFISDHGESLGEYGIYKHGIPVPFAPDAQKYVPFFVWFSDKYKNNYPQKVLNILTHDRSSPLSHDFIFHSLLDCADISSSALKNELSVCSTVKT